MSQIPLSCKLENPIFRQTKREKKSSEFAACNLANVVFFGLWPSSQSYARVDFDQPFSLKEFKGKWEQRLVFRQEEESQIHEKVKSALAAHSLYISWHTSRFMLTDLLAFLSSTIKGQDRRHHQINATKLKALIDDIQMRKRFIGFIGPFIRFAGSFGDSFDYKLD